MHAWLTVCTCSSFCVLKTPRTGMAIKAAKLEVLLAALSEIKRSHRTEQRKKIMAHLHAYISLSFTPKHSFLQLFVVFHWASDSFPIPMSSVSFPLWYFFFLSHLLKAIISKSTLTKISQIIAFLSCAMSPYFKFFSPTYFSSFLTTKKKACLIFSYSFEIVFFL